MSTENKIDGVSFFEFVETVRLIFNKPEGNLKDLLERLQLARNLEQVHRISGKEVEGELVSKT
jgi:hypothetical protein